MQANKRACRWQPNAVLSRGSHAYPGAYGWSRWGGTGRRCVPRVGRPIRSGGPPVASCSCVRVSSLVAVRPAGAGWGARGMRPRHDRRPGGQSGVWCVWRWPRGVPVRAGTRSGGLTGPDLRTAAPQERRSGLVGGGRAWGCRGTNAIARRRTPCQAASVRGPSNQVLSEVLRAGHASTAGRSPEHSR